MKPPPRLVEDPSAPPELRADLQRAAAAPFPYDAAAGLAGLQAAIGSLPSTAAASASPAAASATPSATAASKLGVLLGGAGGKLGLVATAAVIAASVAFWPTRSQPTQPRARPKAAPAQAQPDAPSALPQPASPTGPAVVAVAEPRAAQAQARVARRATRDPDAAMRLEIAELGHIRTLLTSDPEQAYRLASAGHRRFVRGMLRQEREGLAILALHHMGRRGEAARRSELFLARYPRSPLRAELERALQIERAPGESD